MLVARSGAGGQCLVGPDTIHPTAGRYFLEQLGIDENAGLTGDIDITDDLTIVGTGREATAIDWRRIDYVFEVAASVDLTVRQLGIVNVSMDLPMEQPAGGGIRAGYFGEGDVWATRVVLEDFLLDASTDLFESISMQGSLSIDRSIFRNAGKQMPLMVQAIRVSEPSTTIRHSEFIDNIRALSVSGPDRTSSVPVHISDTRFIGGGGADVYCPAIDFGDAGVLQRVAVSGFSAISGWAVVCTTSSALSIRKSSFFANRAAAVSVEHLSFPSHVATIDGNAILVDVRGVLTLSNSTVTAAPGATRWIYATAQSTASTVSSPAPAGCNPEWVSGPAAPTSRDRAAPAFRTPA